jgi:hypothetical protein
MASNWGTLCTKTQRIKLRSWPTQGWSWHEEMLYSETQQIKLPIWPTQAGSLKWLLQELKGNTSCLCLFAKACKRTIEFVRGVLNLQQSDDHPLLQLQAEYIKQRLIVLLDRYEQWQYDCYPYKVEGHTELA